MALERKINGQDTCTTQSTYSNIMTSLLKVSVSLSLPRKDDKDSDKTYSILFLRFSMGYEEKIGTPLINSESLNALGVWYELPSTHKIDRIVFKSESKDLSKGSTNG